MLDIRCQLGQGRVLSLYGPSGAGKTTILRILSGLTGVASGLIEVDGEAWLDTDRQIDLPTRHRSIGFVFQDFALFPHLSVRKQLEYALPKNEDKKSVSGILALMELEGLEHHRPAHLSGGQQQRVALARAIARRPRLLLLDEPLSALDDEMRSKLQDYLLKVHRHYGLTTLLVSHYLPEIFRLADEVLVLEKGKVTKQGSPASLFYEEMDNGTFRTTGEIIDILPAGSGKGFIISVLCADTLIKAPATAEEAAGLHPGKKVRVASQTFNPVIQPLP